MYYPSLISNPFQFRLPIDMLNPIDLSVDSIDGHCLSPTGFILTLAIVLILSILSRFFATKTINFLNHQSIINRVLNTNREVIPLLNETASPTHSGVPVLEHPSTYLLPFFL